RYYRQQRGRKSAEGQGKSSAPARVPRILASAAQVVVAASRMPCSPRLFRKPLPPRGAGSDDRGDRCHEPMADIVDRYVRNPPESGLRVETYLQAPRTRLRRWFHNLRRKESHIRRRVRFFVA